MTERLVDTSILDGYESIDPDRELRTQLYQYYRDQVPQLLQKLNSYVDEKNFKEAKRQLHAMKNSFGNVGAREVAQECQTIEDTLEDMSPTELTNTMARLETLFLRVREELSAHLGLP